MSKSSKALLSAIAATAAAVVIGSLSSSCFVAEADKGSATVMYTWSDAEFPYIQSIAASYNDVRYWYEQVYMAANYNDDNATAAPIPPITGSSDIPDNIYSKDRPQDATKYKGVCLPISKGKYTAICTVNDPVRNKTVYIVANYSINVGEPGTKKYYEVAFDVRKVLDGWIGGSDTAWVFREYADNPCYK